MNSFLQIIESYKLAFLFIGLALPLALIPVLAEALQHFAEYKLGMFALQKGDVFGNDKQAVRLIFGVIKVTSVLAILIFLPKFFNGGRSLSKALQLRADGKRVLIGVSLVAVLSIILIFVILPKVLALFLPDIEGGKLILLSLLTYVFLSMLFQNYANKWFAKLWGFEPPDKARNKAINRALFMTGIPVQLAAILPVMVVHYKLGSVAMGEGGFKLFGILALDSIVVGLLAALISSCIYVVFRDAITQSDVGQT